VRGKRRENITDLPTGDGKSCSKRRVFPCSPRLVLGISHVLRGGEKGIRPYVGRDIDCVHSEEKLRWVKRRKLSPTL